MLGGTALAETTTLHGIVQVTSSNGLNELPSKYYDYDNGVVCYRAWGTGGGISCLKN